MKDSALSPGIEPKKILQNVIDKKIPAIMSYLSKSKWHVAKVILTGIEGNRLSIESTFSKNQQRPINIQIHQPVGISFKFGYGKFVFDTTVKDLEPSQQPQSNQGRGGTIVIEVPDKMELVQRRSYFRIDVPASLKVKVLLWHRSGKSKIEDTTEQTRNCWQGRLVDISAGGAQVVMSQQSDAPESDFKKGQFIGMRFTPLPYETPMVLSAQIRNILPTADGKNISIGIQFIGLEASSEGRRNLTRLASIVERYYQINQSGVKQTDAQPVSNAV